MTAVTDATAHPPLDLPDTVTITRELYEHLVAAANVGAMASGILDAHLALGLCAPTPAIDEWLDARAALNEMRAA